MAADESGPRAVSCMVLRAHAATECRWGRVIGAAHHACLRNVTVNKRDTVSEVLGSFALRAALGVLSSARTSAILSASNMFRSVPVPSRKLSRTGRCREGYSQELSCLD